MTPIQILHYAPHHSAVTHQFTSHTPHNSIVHLASYTRYHFHIPTMYPWYCNRPMSTSHHIASLCLHVCAMGMNTTSWVCVHAVPIKSQNIGLLHSLLTINFTYNYYIVCSTNSRTSEGLKMSTREWEKESVLSGDNCMLLAHRP